jgi:peptidoglycan/LPS O-acetylase OafA/YrhL
MKNYKVAMPMTAADDGHGPLPDSAGAWARLLHWVGNVSLRRITTSAKLIPQIDGLRFIAIVIVLIDHILNQGAPFMSTGGFLAAVDRRAIGFRAVYLFFTLSGFILALPFARQYLQDGRHVDIPAYFRRRLTRLEPPFIVAMLLRLIAFLAFTTVSTGTIFVHFIASIFYLHSAIFGPASSINIPAWSLEIEVQFYIVAPLLAMLFRVRPAWLRRGIVIAAILAFSFASQLPAFLFNQRLFFSLLCNLQYFLAGFLVCDLYVLRDFYRERSYSWDIAGVGCLLYIVWATNSWSGISDPLANSIICLAAFYGHLLPRFLSLAFVGIVGGMCYSIYLTHNSVITGVHVFLVHIPGLTSHWLAFNTALFSLSIAATLFVGTLFFVLIERPCMDPQWPSKAMAWFSSRHPRQMGRR